MTFPTTEPEEESTFQVEDSTPETEEEPDEDLVAKENAGTPPDPDAHMLGAATGSLSAANPEDPLYVPVTNVNYIPDDARGKVLEGYVPDTPGDDRTLNRIKMALETQGLESGPDKPGGGPLEDGPVE